MEQLRSNDLMIDDWVKYSKGRYTDIRQAQLIDIEMFCEGIIFLEPIQITPEILKKNGFEDIGDDTYQLEEKPYWFWVDFFNHEYGCEHDTSTYEYEDSERCFRKAGIPYVHELQHAMRIFGIEKDIVF